MSHNIMEESVVDSKIINLRLQGMSEFEIIKHLKTEMEVGKYIDRIYFICRNMVVQSNAKTTIKNVRELDDIIFDLNERGLMYEGIARQLGELGILISIEATIERCRVIYTQKGITPSRRGRKTVGVSDEKIFELRQQGLYYREIAEQLQKEGIQISRPRVHQRCKKIYAEKGIEEPKVKIGRNKNEKYTKSRMDISKIDPEKILRIFNNIQRRKKLQELN